MDRIPGLNLLRQARDATRLAFAIKEHRRQQQRQQQLVQRENDKQLLLKDEKAVAKVREIFEQGNYKEFCSLYFGDFFVQRVMDMKDVFFKIWDLYWLLLILRLSLVFWPQPGYFHPDEFMQSLEVVSNDVFNWNTTRTWEWNTDKPIRNSLIPSLLYGIPLKLMSILDESYFKILSSYAVVVVPRFIMFILSLSVDVAVFRLCQLYQHSFNVCLVTLGSSYLMLTMATRTLSNAIEMVLFSWLLYLVCYSLRVTHETLFLHDLIDASHSQASSIRDKVSISKKRKLIPKHEFRHFLAIAAIVVIGCFNRPTFLCFAIAPLFFWMIRGVVIKANRFDSSMYIFNLRMLLFTSCFVVFSSIFVIADSMYFGELTWTKLFELEFDWSDFRVTPLSFILYNIKKENVAQHGLHPRYLHATVNLALLFGPLSLCFFYSLFTYLKSMIISPWHLKPSLRSAQTVLLFSILVPLTVLSLVPHQEPRFLLPLTMPAVLLSSHLLRNCIGGRHILLSAWYGFNIVATLFYGFAHQGGMMATLNFVSKNDISDDSKIVFSGTYMPYTFTLMGKSVDIIDVGSSLKEDELADLLSTSLGNMKQNESKIYLVTSLSTTSKIGNNEGLRFKQVFRVWPHVSMEVLPQVIEQWWSHMSRAHANMDFLSTDNLLHLGKDVLKLINDFSLVVLEVSAID